MNNSNPSSDVLPDKSAAMRAAIIAAVEKLEGPKLAAIHKIVIQSDTAIDKAELRRRAEWLSSQGSSGVIGMAFGIAACVICGKDTRIGSRYRDHLRNRHAADVLALPADRFPWERQ